MSDPPFIERQTLCLPGPVPGIAIHAGEPDFANNVGKHYATLENNIAEKLVQLKHELVRRDGEGFWNKLMEGMTDICDAQFAFVSKRILVDDQQTAVEMPPIGEVGSCLMAVALYFNDGKGIEGSFRDYKYYAWSAPCAYMKHDKVFVIPNELNTFIQNNPNDIPFEPEAYLGVPLFAEGKCFAHFGMMWTKEALARIQSVSWAFLELFMHSIEDMIIERLLSGKSFQKKPEQAHRASESARIIPQSAITVAQSLKPYARSLSHELRTPMQGVVGMLDVMYTTIQEQLEGHPNSKVRAIFQSLKESVEVIQDSSKRAVEAADNVVQAYDLDMQVPQTPTMDCDSEKNKMSSYFDVKPIKPSMSRGGQIYNTGKRKREGEDGWNHDDHPAKLRSSEEARECSPWSGTSSIRNPSPIRRRTPPLFNPNNRSNLIQLPTNTIITPPEHDMTLSTPCARQSNIRELLPIVINESLRVGGRPDYAVSEPSPLGERIEVRTRSPHGHTAQKVITWAVDPDVPIYLPLDEKDLSKLVSVLFLNAVKFTDNGTIDIQVRLSTSGRYCTIGVADTGTGIPLTFRSELFKPFSQEDDSLTRSREGLGLGLLVAKGLARRTGGDLRLIWTSVGVDDHGSKFEIRVPVEPGEYSSRASTPLNGSMEPMTARSVPGAASGSAVSTAPVTSRTGSPGTVQEPSRDCMSPSRVTTPNIIDLARRTSNTPKPGSVEARPQNHKRVSSTANNDSTANKPQLDKDMAKKWPLKIMVAEDNKLNRKLLVNMLGKLGYKGVHEAFDGVEAVRVFDSLAQEKRTRQPSHTAPVVDVILMDLWMPGMDGYQATEKIMEMYHDPDLCVDTMDCDTHPELGPPPKILAVSADVTDRAIDKASQVGMQGYLTKPYNLSDLQKLLTDFCISKGTV